MALLNPGCRLRITGLCLASALLIQSSCRTGERAPAIPEIREDNAPLVIEVPRPVTIDAYFGFMDSLAATYQPRLSYPVSEHLLVHANPWVLDTLKETDYYRRMARDSFVYDQKLQIALAAGSRIIIPDSSRAAEIYRRMGALRLDVNIPEYRLRIFEDSTELYALPVRVGQNRTRYLAMSGVETDLRTHPGRGFIIRHERNPVFYDPVEGTRYYHTRRDDGRRTLMPRIPWIETEINGQRNGQLLHPTTNPQTLGKAYSNGCIGMGEADAWIVYYHAPLGTPVQIRYNLEASYGEKDPEVFRDIYGLGTHGARNRP